MQYSKNSTPFLIIDLNSMGVVFSIHQTIGFTGSDNSSSGFFLEIPSVDHISIVNLVNSCHIISLRVEITYPRIVKSRFKVVIRNLNQAVLDSHTNYSRVSYGFASIFLWVFRFINIINYNVGIFRVIVNLIVTSLRFIE